MLVICWGEPSGERGEGGVRAGLELSKKGFELESRAPGHELEHRVGFTLRQGGLFSPQPFVPLFLQSLRAKWG